MAYIQCFVWQKLKQVLCILYIRPASVSAKQNIIARDGFVFSATTASREISCQSQLKLGSPPMMTGTQYKENRNPHIHISDFNEVHYQVEQWSDEQKKIWGGLLQPREGCVHKGRSTILCNLKDSSTQYFAFSQYMLTFHVKVSKTIPFNFFSWPCLLEKLASTR